MEEIVKFLKEVGRGLTLGSTIKKDKAELKDL